MSTGSRRFSLMTTVLLAGALGMLLLTVGVDPVRLSATFVVLAAAVLAAEFLSVQLGEGSISLSYPLSVASLALLGPTSGALVALACMVPAAKDARLQPTRFAFNAAQLVICSVASGWLYGLSGGRLLAASPLQASDFPGAAVPSAVLVISGVAMNFLLVSAGFAVLQSTAISRVLRGSFLWVLPTQVALGFVGLTIAQVMAALGPIGLVLFVAPLVAAREAYNRYWALRGAYGNMVRSLVGAIEAKDPYTRGHSERVAALSMRIGQSLGMSTHDLERLEYAALLHDLGKVGVPTGVLTKAGPLSIEEQSLIREHPRVGAEIIAEVPYLAEVAGAILHHHERMDGSGYVSGAHGDSIPLAARVLAVADSIDAMATARPYRAALPIDAVLAEIRAGSGSQYDASIVEAIMSSDCTDWGYEVQRDAG